MDTLFVISACLSILTRCTSTRFKIRGIGALAKRTSNAGGEQLQGRAGIVYKHEFPRRMFSFSHNLRAADFQIQTSSPVFVPSVLAQLVLTVM
jgi:hypothetical protein